MDAHQSLDYWECQSGGKPPSAQSFAWSRTLTSCRRERLVNPRDSSPATRQTETFVAVFTAAHQSQPWFTRTLRPRGSLSAVSSAPQCSQCSTLGCTNRKWQKTFQRKFNTLIALVGRWTVFLLLFPTFSYHSKAPPTLCCPKDSGFAPNPRHRELSSPGGGKKSEKSLLT